MFVLRLITALSLIGISAWSFESGRLYTYDLRGIVGSRNIQGVQYSGYTFRSPLLVQRVSNDELTLQLDGLQIATFNEDVDSWFSFAPHERIQPTENWVNFSRPFGVHYENGTIKAFDTYKDEPKWVSNFKRGLIGFFQINSTHLTPGKVAVSPYRHVDDCDYPVSIVEQSNSFNLSKLRFVETCGRKFLRRHMPFEFVECPVDEEDSRNISSLAVQTELTGPRSNPVIKTVDMHERSTYTPFGLPTREHQIMTRLTMRLLNESSEGSITVHKDAMRNHEVHYEPPDVPDFYTNSSLEDAHFLANIFDVRSSAEDVLELMDLFVKEQQDYLLNFRGSLDYSPSSNSMRRRRLRERLERSFLGSKFMRLSVLLGTLNLKNIDTLYRRVMRRGEMHENVFWDLIGVVGTNPSLVFIRRLIESSSAPLAKLKGLFSQSNAPSSRIQDYLLNLPFHIKTPGKRLFDEYLSLCQAPKIQSQPIFRRSCLLSFSSLIRQHCVRPHARSLRAQHGGLDEAEVGAEQHAQPANGTCKLLTAEHFSELLLTSSGNQQKPDLSEKMFRTKLAGELATRVSVYHMLELVHNRREHAALRAAAVGSLTKLAPLYAKFVRGPVSSLFHDTRESTTIRVAAYEAWFAAGMSDQDIPAIVDHMESEPDEQLVAFVLSHIKRVVLATIPCTPSRNSVSQATSSRVDKILAQRNLARPNLSSQTMLYLNQSPDLLHGSITKSSITFENQTVTHSVPSRIQLDKQLIISGLKVSHLQLDIQLHGLEKPFKRLVQRGNTSDWFDLFAPYKLSLREALPPIFARKSTAREEFDEAYVAVTVSLWGRALAFLDLEPQDFRSLIADDGSIILPRLERLLESIRDQKILFRTASDIETLELWNNALGLPLMHMANDINFFQSELEDFELDAKPAFFREDRRGEPLDEFSFGLKYKYGYHEEMFSWTGSFLPHTKQVLGAGFFKKSIVGLALDVSLRANLTGRKVELQVSPVQDNAAFAYHTPVTFVDSYDPNAAYNSSSWRPFISIDQDSHSRNKADDGVLIVDFMESQMSPLALGYRVEGLHRIDQNLSQILDNIAQSQQIHHTPSTKPFVASFSTTTTGFNENPTNKLTLQVSWDNPTIGQNAVPAPANHTHANQASSQPRNGTSLMIRALGGSTKQRYATFRLDCLQGSGVEPRKWTAAFEASPLNQSEPPIELTKSGELPAGLDQLNMGASFKP